MSRLGRALPVSMKQTWRGETSASIARASWLMRRTWRQCWSRAPTGLVRDEGGWT